ncbi:flagellar hook-basal body complex protein [Clostridium aminobutyricum]|uniref:Flagellar hook protein FlgE n=1 Tax=Clostridium aminobutyricum TaxID=33953 RepID=A0A939D997_CLOAM|nr:flagellar hook-basal body complex protein [Clostridium aminobutyricum]MBN7773764.1 flagellar hook-basal body complex protein [Clostridium aminobutyricum]
MVKSMFAAVAGLRAHQTKMDVIGNNIANVNTYGYKSARATFTDMFYATSAGAGSSGNVYGGTNPTQIGYGSKISSIDSLMTTGGTAATDNPTDCMITGNGFFVVGAKDKEVTLTEGSDTAVGGVPADADNATKLSSLSYTRVGKFNFDEDGYLVDSAGMIVYGFATDDADADGEIDTTKLVPIKLPNATSDANSGPIQLSSISIGKDGTITGKNDNGEIVTVGQIAIANVPNPNALERNEGGYYIAKNNTGTITINPSGQNSTGSIAGGCLEMSNVDLSKEFTEMITCQRGFQANTRIITVTDAMLEELVNIKR